ncbi:MAG: hypothetical protein PHX21_12980 [bacterium]|nr:hypothetical protein [bacterium]
MTTKERMQQIETAIRNFSNYKTLPVKDKLYIMSYLSNSIEAICDKKTWDKIDFWNQELLIAASEGHYQKNIIRTIAKTSSSDRMLTSPPAVIKQRVNKWIEDIINVYYKIIKPELTGHQTQIGSATGTLPKKKSVTCAQLDKIQDIIDEKGRMSILGEAGTAYLALSARHVDWKGFKLGDRAAAPLIDFWGEVYKKLGINLSMLYLAKIVLDYLYPKKVQYWDIEDKRFENAIKRWKKLSDKYSRN